MRPIEEIGKGSTKIYGKWFVKNSKEQCYTNSSKKVTYFKSTYPHLYYGRGYVQLTWFDNYLKMGDLLVDNQIIDDPKLFINDPSKAMDPTYATYILVLGMVNGLFTGVPLNKYINSERCDFVNARKVVNGLDKADLIASYAKSFI